MANQVPGPTTPAGPQPYDYGALLGMVVYDYKPSTEQWKRIFETLWQRGIANYNPLFGAAAGQPVFVEGKWRMAKETVTGAYDPAKFDDINAGADRYGYPQWDGEAHDAGYRCTNRARLWEATQDVPAGIEPGTEEGADYFTEISPSTGALEPFRQTLYKGGETCYALGLIWSVPGDPDTIFDSRPFLSPIAAGFNVESGGIRFYDGSEYGEIVNAPLEFTGTISRSGNVINGTPRIIPALRQDVIELRTLGESNPALGLIPGKYRIIDALEREDPDHPGDPDYLLHDEMIVEALEGNRLAKRAYNNTSGKEGIYGLDDGEGGVDTWVEDAGGGGGGGSPTQVLPYKHQSYLLTTDNTGVFGVSDKGGNLPFGISWAKAAPGEFAAEYATSVASPELVQVVFKSIAEGLGADEYTGGLVTSVEKTTTGFKMKTGGIDGLNDAFLLDGGHYVEVRYFDGEGTVAGGGGGGGGGASPFSKVYKAELFIDNTFTINVNSIFRNDFAGDVTWETYGASPAGFYVRPSSVPGVTLDQVDGDYNSVFLMAHPTALVSGLPVSNEYDFTRDGNVPSLRCTNVSFEFMRIIVEMEYKN